MAIALLHGNKIGTTRYKRLNEREVYKAVAGSRYKAKKIGYVTVVGRITTTWRKVAQDLFNFEGFESPRDMVDFLRKEKLIKKSLDDKVYFHDIIFDKQSHHVS